MKTSSPSQGLIAACVEVSVLSFLDILAIRSTECLVLATGEAV